MQLSLENYMRYVSIPHSRIQLDKQYYYNPLLRCICCKIQRKPENIDIEEYDTAVVFFKVATNLESFKF